MPAIVGGLISAGGSLLGGILGGNAQDKAAKQAAEQAQQARAWTQAVYGNAATGLNPYITTGQNALYSLSSLYGLGNGPQDQGSGADQAFQDFTHTQAYQFPQQQGNLAANRALAAQGLTGSGAQVKGISQYNQGYASQGFDSYLSRLQQLAGGGSQAASSLGSIGVGASGVINNASQYIGSALAGGTIGQANSMNQGIGGFLGALGNNGTGGSNPSGSSFGPSSAFGSGVNYLKGLFG